MIIKTVDEDDITFTKGLDGFADRKERAGVILNYYIADTHFGHDNVIKYDFENGGRRFDSIEEHDNFIVENWNKVVTPQDNVYVIGDFSWFYARKTEEIIKKLNGAKFLVKGNHDRWSKDSACRDLFHGIYDYKMIHDEKKAIVMSHYPILFYQNQHRNSIHLYGHVHNTREETIFQETCKNISKTTDIPMNCYNVGCMIDYMDYTPRTLEEILESNK